MKGPLRGNEGPKRNEESGEAGNEGPACGGNEEMSEEAIEEKVKTLFERLKLVEDKLFGNGRTGLVEDVSAMKSDLTTIKKQNLAIFGTLIAVLARLLFG